MLLYLAGGGLVERAGKGKRQVIRLIFIEAEVIDIGVSGMPTYLL